MTQLSIIQEGSKLQTPTLLDSGPYNAIKYAAMLHDIHQGGLAVSGPLSGVHNELITANPSAANMQINTGAALVLGHYFSSDSSVTIAAGSPSVNSRIDVIVAVQNSTSNGVTAGVVSGNALLFPVVLTDYAGIAEVPRDTTRLAILTGDESGSPVAPALDSDPSGVSMVALGQYEISTGGAITDFKDRRIFSVGGNANGKLMEMTALGGEEGMYFENLPTGFNGFKILWRAQSTRHGTDRPVIVIDLNHLTLMNFHGTTETSQIISPGPGTLAVGQTILSTLGLSDIDTGIYANDPGAGMLEFWGVQDSVWEIAVNGRVTWQWDQDATPTWNTITFQGTVVASQAEPMTSLGFYVSNSNDGKFVAGSHFTLYGIR